MKPTGAKIGKQKRKGKIFFQTALKTTVYFFAFSPNISFTF